MLSTKFNINIDRAIGAPGHGKDIVDGLNAVDKHYLKKIMRITKCAHEDNSDIKKIKVHTVHEDENISIAKEAARILKLDRSFGSKGSSKHKLREHNRVIKERHYHVHNEISDKVDNVNMKFSGFTNKIGEKYNGMLACYHLHVDPQLSINKAALQRIPCACESCVNKLSLKWVNNVAAKNQMVLIIGGWKLLGLKPNAP